MADSSGDRFTLNLKAFDSTIQQFQSLANFSSELQATFKHILERATDGWVGQSRKEFENKAYMLFQQCSDISEALFEVGETLLKSSEAYMQADVDLAKTMDGKSNRY